MGTIIGISGGFSFPIEEFIVKSANKPNPKILFIPTASADNLDYIISLYNLFGRQLGCKCDILSLIFHKFSQQELQKKFLAADIIYVGGGSAYDMFEIWREYNLEKFIKEAYDKGTVLAGTSAGAICWFKYGNGDSNFHYGKKGLEYRKVVGTGIINAMCYPHYDCAQDKTLEKLLKFYDKNTPVIAIEDNAAIVIINDKYKIVRTDNFAKAYKISLDGSFFTKRPIVWDNFMDIKGLI